MTKAITQYVGRLNGAQTLGKGPGFWLSMATILAAALAFPLFASSYEVGNFAYFFVWLFMAMGLCLMWGYGGIMSFGQTFFFGIAGYAYGVLSINLGGVGVVTFVALIASVIVATAAAAVLGYFMIWGRVAGIFFGIVTLAATLVLTFFLNQTAGPEWAIGSARLNGFNGMTGIKPLNLVFGEERIVFRGVYLYYLLLAMLVLVYLGLRLLLNSRFGNTLVAIREDENRAELLGYDVRVYRLVTFCIGSGLAGLSGALYAAWGQFISPTTIGLPAAMMPVVWVAFSGRRELTATMLGSFIFMAVYQLITVYSQQVALIVTGIILLATVTFAPEGFIIGLIKLAYRLRPRAGGGSTAILGQQVSE